MITGRRRPRPSLAPAAALVGALAVAALLFGGCGRDEPGGDGGGGGPTIPDLPDTVTIDGSVLTVPDITLPDVSLPDMTVPDTLSVPVPSVTRP